MEPTESGGYYNYTHTCPEQAPDLTGYYFCCPRVMTRTCTIFLLAFVEFVTGGKRCKQSLWVARVAVFSHKQGAFEGRS